MINIPRDKQYHLAAGAIICLAVGVVFKNLNYGFIASIVIGAAKEWIYDAGVNYYLKRKGQPPAHDVDFLDFFCTALGGALMVALLMAIDQLK